MNRCTSNTLLKFVGFKLISTKNVRFISSFKPFMNKNDDLSVRKQSNLVNNVEIKNEPTREEFVFIGNKRADAQLDRFVRKLFQLMGIYEEMIGLKELKSAQQSVIDAEKRFIDAQELRRTLSTRLVGLQLKLKDLRNQMDRLNRTDTQYLKFFTQEHECLNEEKLILHEYTVKEEEERELFYRLSTLLRESQEKERARAERIKYLQLTLSIACTFLGLFSAFLISYLRRSEIKEVLEHGQNSFENLSIKIEHFNNEQSEFNKTLKNIFFIEQIGSSNDPATTKLVNLKELFEQQLNLINTNFNKLNEKINKNDENSFNSKLNQQNNLVRVTLLTSALSLLFLSFNYFSKSQ